MPPRAPIVPVEVWRDALRFPALRSLREVAAYPAPADAASPPPGAVLVPLRIATQAGTLSFFSTTTVFGTPLDVTLSELAIEMFFAADAATDALVRRLDAAALAP